MLDRELVLNLELHSCEIFVALVMDAYMEVQRTEIILGYGALHLQKKTLTSCYKDIGALHLLEPI